MRRTRSVEAAAAKLGARTLVVASLAAIAFSGCSSDKPAPPPPAPVASTPAAPDPASVKANEAGVVPVLEFRDIGPGSGNTTPADFKKDLQWLYDNNYRPVGLTDFVAGKVDCPPGKMPVILTFDDGLPGQYRMDKMGNTDPNCGAALLEAFSRNHDDWPLAGAFFIDAASGQNGTEFGSKQATDYKLEHLNVDGFEIGCGLPANFGSLPDGKITETLATVIPKLTSTGKGNPVGILSIPVGAYPKNLSLLQSGSIQVATPQPVGDPHAFKGKPQMHMVNHQVPFKTKGAVTGGDKPSPSPASPKFDGYHIPRIAVSSSRSVESALKSIKDPFVSDGDPTTIAVPAAEKANVDADRMQSAGITVKTY